MRPSTYLRKGRVFNWRPPLCLAKRLLVLLSFDRFLLVGIISTNYTALCRSIAIVLAGLQHN